MAKPLFMWAGGKTKLLSRYAPLFPDKGSVSAYVEPFMGGAALMGRVMEEMPGLPVIGGDVNGELTRLFNAVKNGATSLLSAAEVYEKDWLAETSKEERKKLFYALRKKYWGLPEGDEADALLLFLMKTAFNGIWQTCRESKGRFGTPVGLANQTGPLFDRENFREWERLLKASSARISTGSYAELDVPEGAWVFCDPPYRDSFTSYGTVFGDDAQMALIEWSRRTAKEKRALVWLANREAEDPFFETHAPDAVVHKFPVTYTAGRRKKTEEGFEAKKAVDLLVVWDGRKKSA